MQALASLRPFDARERAGDCRERNRFSCNERTAERVERGVNKESSKGTLM